MAKQITNRLFSEKCGQPVFSATMVCKRFKFLSSHLFFDNAATTAQRWKQDRFPAFREIFKEFNDNCMRHLTQSEYLSLDKTLYPMHNRILFKPSKPAKYQLLFHPLNHARVRYPYRSMVYTGKLKKLPSVHYICGNENYVMQVVSTVYDCLCVQGRNVSMDRLYTSIRLGQWLLDKKLTCIGTMHSNCVGIQEELKATKDKGSPQHKDGLGEEQERDCPDIIHGQLFERQEERPCVVDSQATYGHYQGLPIPQASCDQAV